MANRHITLLSLIFIIIALAPELCESNKTFTLVNYCKETIWPGITRTDNNSGNGFTLKPGESTIYTAPSNWSGRIWGRTGCNFDNNGNGKCRTGSCGTNINCTGPGNPPATIADFTLGELDFYDVSLVDGFNLPITIRAMNGTGNCSTAGCDGDLRLNCPSELAAKENGEVIACRSACDAFDTDEYCCRGSFENPATCLPSNYSRIFKQVCPAAYSFAHDDATGLLTCSGADFVVMFCGSRNQTVCSYHDKQLECNNNVRSKAYKAIPQRWWVLMLPLTYMFNLRITF